MANIRLNDFTKDFFRRFGLDYQSIKKFYDYEWELYASTYNMTIEEFKKELYKPHISTIKTKAKGLKNTVKDMNAYMYYSTTRQNFKGIAKRRGWVFEDFEQTLDETTINRYNKKYFFKLKK